MGLFSCFKKKKDAEKNKELIISYIWDSVLPYCKSIKCDIGSIMDVYLEAAVIVNALSAESIKETMREWNISNTEHAALKFIENSAWSHISQRAKQGGDVDSVHKLYEAVVNTKYERGFISKAQYETKLSYGIRRKTGN
jgi:predicted transcriptional regulator